MAIVAGVAFGYAHKLLVDDHAATTWINISNNESVFYIELVCWVVIVITDLMVSISLFHFFKNADYQISGLAAAMRIIYTLVLSVAIWQLFKIVPILRSQPELYDNNIVEQTAAHFEAFEILWSWGLVIFGLHLLGLGYLAYKSNHVNNLFAILLLIAGLSYSVIHISRRLEIFDSETINAAEGLLTLPMALSEILFAFWLIYFGLKKKKSINDASEQKNLK